MKKLATVLFLGLTSAAHADDASMAPPEVATVAKWVNDAKDGNYHNLPHGELAAGNRTATKCHDQLDVYANKATLIETDAFQRFGAKQNAAKEWVLTVADAVKVCDEGLFYKNVVLKDLAVFQRMNIDDARLAGWEKDGLEAHAIESMKPDVDRCPLAVDELLAAKLPPTYPFKLGPAKTIADLKPMICEAGKKAMAAYLDKLGQKDAKAKEPYIKAGIKGDKLDLMLEYGGSIFLTGKRAPDGLKPYAAASTMFTWSTSDADDYGYVVHTVRKYIFKGNNLVRTSEKTFRRRQGEDLGAAAFK